MSLARASARRITNRGSPSYGSPPGLSTSQNSRPTLWVSPVRHGRIRNVPGSGMATMSDSSIRLNPVIDEPSKPMPSSSAPGSSSRPTAKDFSWPKMSVNQNRMNSTLCSSTWASTSLAPVVLSGAIAIEHLLCFVCLKDGLALFAGADPHRVLHGEHEELAVPHRARAGVAQDHVLDQVHVLRLDHALELELGPQVHGQLGAPVVLGDRLLPARALDLADGQAREARLEQILADRLESLVPDVGDDHLHAVTSPGRAVAMDAPAGAGSRTAARPPEAAPISGAGMNCSG